MCICSSIRVYSFTCVNSVSRQLGEADLTGICAAGCTLGEALSKRATGKVSARIEEKDKSRGCSIGCAGWAGYSDVSPLGLPAVHK